jgi:hypothetical protein
MEGIADPIRELPALAPPPTAEATMVEKTVVVETSPPTPGDPESPKTVVDKTVGEKTVIETSPPTPARRLRIAQDGPSLRVPHLP